MAELHFGASSRHARKLPARSSLTKISLARVRLSYGWWWLRPSELYWVTAGIKMDKDGSTELLHQTSLEDVDIPLTRSTNFMISASANISAASIKKAISPLRHLPGTKGNSSLSSAIVSHCVPCLKSESGQMEHEQSKLECCFIWFPSGAVVVASPLVSLQSMESLQPACVPDLPCAASISAICTVTPAISPNANNIIEVQGRKIKHQLGALTSCYWWLLVISKIDHPNSLNFFGRATHLGHPVVLLVGLGPLPHWRCWTPQMVMAAAIQGAQVWDNWQAHLSFSLIRIIKHN